MATVIVGNSRCISLGSIENEQDLLRRKGIVNINPPPENGRCDCCGRHISELKPFGKAGDPLVGDFCGELLVKRWRMLLPYDTRPQSIHGEFVAVPPGLGLGGPVGSLVEKSGDENALEIRLYQLTGQNKVGPSWECRDCIVLDEDEYYERMDKRWREGHK